MKIELVDLQNAEIDAEFVRRVAHGAAADADAQAGALTIALVDDARIAELNRAHRRLDRPTDVLAYGGGEDDPDYLGDVVISVETAARQAAEAGRPTLHEVAWLAAHGVLHLLGYDDATDPARTAMITRQDRALEASVQEEGSQRQ